MGADLSLFSSGSLAPALPGLISYLLQRIFSVMVSAGGVGLQGLLFTADIASPPVGDPHLRGHAGTAFISSLIHQAEGTPTVSWACSQVRQD